MTKNSIEKIHIIFAKVFPDITMLGSLQRGRHPWDSLKHIELLNAIECEFKVSLNLKIALKIMDITSAIHELEKVGIE